MRTNPHDKSRIEADRHLDYAFIRKHYVSSSPLEQIFGLPAVSSQEGGVPVADVSGVMNPVHGDHYIPPEGSPVYTAPNSKGETTVIGAHTPEGNTPLLVPGERILSHPLSKAFVKFNVDGSVNVSCDPGEDLYLNENLGSSGMARPITDINFGKEEIARTPNVWVPSGGSV